MRSANPIRKPGRSKWGRSRSDRLSMYGRHFISDLGFGIWEKAAVGCPDQEPIPAEIPNPSSQIPNATGPLYLRFPICDSRLVGIRTPFVRVRRRIAHSASRVNAYLMRVGEIENRKSKIDSFSAQERDLAGYGFARYALSDDLCGDRHVAAHRRIEPERLEPDSVRPDQADLFGL